MRKKLFFRKLRYLAQAAPMLPFMLLFTLLPLDLSSSLGGMLARIIGPFLRAHRVAESNIKRVFPQYDDKARRAILSGMWDNLGRVAGEYPHLSTPAMRKRITVEGAEYLEQIRHSGKGAIFISGHFGNWELCPLLSVIYDLDFTFIYREANNPYAEKLVQWMRRDYRRRMFGKGRHSVQQAMKSLKQGKLVALLADQKLNEGESVPFMGFPAMTAVSAARLALKFNVPFVSTRVIRTDGAHFHVTIGAPRLYDASADPLKVTEDINLLFERWIRERPEQWFWVHNRWNWKL